MGRPFAEGTFADLMTLTWTKGLFVASDNEYEQARREHVATAAVPPSTAASSHKQSTAPFEAAKSFKGERINMELK